jgi:hypothetical protein
MHTQPHTTAPEWFQGKTVVEILGVFGIDGDNKEGPEILAIAGFGTPMAGARALRLLLDLDGESPAESMSPQGRLHLYRQLSLESQDFVEVPRWSSAVAESDLDPLAGYEPRATLPLHVNEPFCPL